MGQNGSAAAERQEPYSRQHSSVRRVSMPPASLDESSHTAITDQLQRPRTLTLSHEQLCENVALGELPTPNVSPRQPRVRARTQGPASVYSNSSPVTPRRLWEPDASRQDCSVCQRMFTNTWRRHHCRTCGRLICSECSKWRDQTNQRVCLRCTDGVYVLTPWWLPPAPLRRRIPHVAGRCVRLLASSCEEAAWRWLSSTSLDSAAEAKARDKLRGKLLVVDPDGNPVVGAVALPVLECRRWADTSSCSAQEDFDDAMLQAVLTAPVAVAAVAAALRAPGDEVDWRSIVLASPLSPLSPPFQHEASLRVEPRVLHRGQLAWVMGSGMEHRDSVTCSLGGQCAQPDLEFHCDRVLVGFRVPEDLGPQPRPFASSWVRKLAETAGAPRPGLQALANAMNCKDGQRVTVHVGMHSASFNLRPEPAPAAELVEAERTVCEGDGCSCSLAPTDGRTDVLALLERNSTAIHLRLGGAEVLYLRRVGCSFSFTVPVFGVPASDHLPLPLVLTVGDGLSFSSPHPVFVQAMSLSAAFHKRRTGNASPTTTIASHPTSRPMAVDRVREAFLVAPDTFRCMDVSHTDCLKLRAKLRRLRLLGKEKIMQLGAPESLRLDYGDFRALCMVQDVVEQYAYWREQPDVKDTIDYFRPLAATLWADATAFELKSILMSGFERGDILFYDLKGREAVRDVDFPDFVSRGLFMVQSWYDRHSHSGFYAVSDAGQPVIVHGVGRRVKVLGTSAAWCYLMKREVDLRKAFEGFGDLTRKWRADAEDKFTDSMQRWMYDAPYVLNHMADLKQIVSIVRGSVRRLKKGEKPEATWKLTLHDESRPDAQPKANQVMCSGFTASVILECFTAVEKWMWAEAKKLPDGAEADALKRCRIRPDLWMHTLAFSPKHLLKWDIWREKLRRQPGVLKIASEAVAKTFAELSLDVHAGGDTIEPLSETSPSPSTASSVPPSPPVSHVVKSGDAVHVPSPLSEEAESPPRRVRASWGPDRSHNARRFEER